MFYGRRKKEIAKMTSINAMVSWGLDSMFSNQKASVAKKGRCFLRGNTKKTKFKFLNVHRKNSPGSST